MTNPTLETYRHHIGQRVADAVMEHFRRGFEEMTTEQFQNYESLIQAKTVQALREMDEHGDVGLDSFLLTRGITPTHSLIEQFSVLLRALQVFAARNERYQDQWKTSGWRGALYDLRKKADRLFRQYWGGAPTPGADEDDAIDAINFAAFFIRGRAERNEWGNWL
jgi:hypothetical protein